MNSTSLADTLRWHMRRTPDPLSGRSMMSNDSIGREIGLSGVTIANFLKKSKSPHKETEDKILAYLDRKGATKAYHAETTPPPTKVDVQELAKMGVKSMKSHYVCGSLDDYDFALLVSSIVSARCDEASRKRLLGILCSQTFPTLA